MTITAPLRRTALGLLAALTLTLSACGDSDAGSALPSAGDAGTQSDAGVTASSPTDADEAIAQYEACMRDLGIDIEMGDGGDGAVTMEMQSNTPAGTDQSTTDDGFDEASAACDPLLEGAFGSFERDPQTEAEEADAALALQRCMADAGYEVDVQGGAVMMMTDDDAMLAMFDECEKQTMPDNVRMNG